MSYIKNVVVNHKTTKFESNSQLSSKRRSRVLCCCQSQNYKIWKQFTTASTSISKSTQLLSITKLQNLKAIHNYRLGWGICALVVVNHKTTKFESNSQHLHPTLPHALCCCQSQNYKIWKQFTTISPSPVRSQLLLSIRKLQNLKAIHNKARSIA